MYQAPCEDGGREGTSPLGRPGRSPHRLLTLPPDTSLTSPAPKGCRTATPRTTEYRVVSTFTPHLPRVPRASAFGAPHPRRTRTGPQWSVLDGLPFMTVSLAAAELCCVWLRFMRH